MNRSVCIPVSLEVQADVPVSAACRVLAEMLIEMEACPPEAAPGILPERRIAVKLPRFSGSVHLGQTSPDACMLHIVGTYTVTMEAVPPDMDVACLQHAAGMRLQRTIDELVKELTERARAHAPA